MRVCLLASGSKGNAILVESGKTRLLIDAGLSAREISNRLLTMDIEPTSLSALLVTHEHIDLVRGLGPFVRRYNLPVYLQSEIAGSLKDVGKTECVREFDTGETFFVQNLSIRPFSISHDSIAPVGFSITGDFGKVGVATDLGVATRLVADCLANCRALILEANHDEEMLRDGPYPWPLKQRVRGNRGHLSNSAAGTLLKNLLWDGLEAVFLGHLSEVNNRPELALRAVSPVLDAQNLCGPQLLLGKQSSPVCWSST